MPIAKKGPRGSDHDRRFEEGKAPVLSFCKDCGRSCIPDASKRCRTCRDPRKRGAPGDARARASAALERASVSVDRVLETVPEERQRETLPAEVLAQRREVAALGRAMRRHGPDKPFTAPPNLTPGDRRRLVAELEPTDAVEIFRTPSPEPLNERRAKEPLEGVARPVTPAASVLTNAAQPDEVEVEAAKIRALEEEAAKLEAQVEQKRVEVVEALTRPTGLYRRGKVWWYEYQVDGFRKRFSLRTTEEEKAIRLVTRLKGVVEQKRQEAAPPPREDVPGELLPAGFSRKDAEKMQALINEGKTQKEVATTFNTSQMTVSRVTRAARGDGVGAERAFTGVVTHLNACATCSRAGGESAPADALCVLGRAFVRRWERLEAETARGAELVKVAPPGYNGNGGSHA